MSPLSHSDFDKVSEEAKELIRSLLVKAPNKRITAVQAIKHPWFIKMG